MLHFKASKFAILATVCLLGIGADRSAHAQAYTVTDLGGLPGSTDSEASGINNAGQVVGSSDGYAIEWSGGSVINLGGLPGSTFSFATGVNDAGQVVGIRIRQRQHPVRYRVERRVHHQPRRAGGRHVEPALGINNAGQVVGSACDGTSYATEWSGGSVINLGGLPGSTASDATASTTPARWWDAAFESTAANTPPSGAVGPSSTSVARKHAKLCPGHQQRRTGGGMERSRSAAARVTPPSGAGVGHQPRRLARKHG